MTAELDALWEPSAIMQQCAEWRGMGEEECYRVWNGGQGMLVVLDRDDVVYGIETARRHGIEAKVCGEITARPSPELLIHSKFTKGNMLRYTPHT